MTLAEYNIIYIDCWILLKRIDLETGLFFYAYSNIRPRKIKKLKYYLGRYLNIWILFLGLGNGSATTDSTFFVTLKP